MAYPNGPTSRYLFRTGLRRGASRVREQPALSVATGDAPSRDARHAPPPVVTSVIAAALALAAVASGPVPVAPGGAASAPSRAAAWVIRVEMNLGGLAYDGVSGPVRGGGGIAADAGLYVRRGVVEGAASAAIVVGGPFSGGAQRFFGAALGVCVPLAATGARSALRAELLAEGGMDEVTGAGLGPDAGVVGAPPVTLPYAGLRAGLAGRIPAGGAGIVLGAWWIERRDLGTRHTIVETGSGAGDRYAIGGATRGLLLRFGVEYAR